MANGPITLTDQDLLDDFQAVMSRYAKKPGKPPLKIVTVGRGGHGKSTLINNLLNLQGEEAAVSYKSGTSVTKGVGVYKNEVNGVTVYIYDTPGLQDESIDERKVIKDVEKMTKGYVDLLFYVSSLNDRINSADERIIKAITYEFKPQVWEHAILVLTHADVCLKEEQLVRLPGEPEDTAEEKYIKYTNGFIKPFQTYIAKQKGCRNIRVKCIQQRTEEVSDNPYEIAAIPTGLYKDSKPDGWYYNLLIEAANKCNKETTPLLLIATSEFGKHVGEENDAIVVGTTNYLAGAGATIGAVTGAAVLGIPSAGLAIPVGAVIGGGLGAGLGYAAGIVAGTATVKWLKYLTPIIKRKRLLEKLKREQELAVAHDRENSV